MLINKILIKHFEKIVGDYNPETHTFVQHKNTSHIFRLYNGLGLSWDVIKKLKDLGCLRIVILLHYQARGKLIGKCPVCNEDYSETEKFETYPDYFIEHGKVWEDANGDYQRIVPLEKLRKRIEVLR